jgi:hypothetical protein
MRSPPPTPAKSDQSKVAPIEIPATPEGKKREHVGSKLAYRLCLRMLEEVLTLTLATNTIITTTAKNTITTAITVTAATTITSTKTKIPLTQPQ